MSALLLFSGQHITRVPVLGGKEVDLYKLFNQVVRRGGILQVVVGRLWREISRELELPPSVKCDAYVLRTQ